jgi:chaperone required for assembly of F1-ATPase
MKRIYKAVTVEHAPAELGEGFVVRLDGRLLKTPAKAPLVLSHEGVARSVAAEWDAQTDQVRPREMPMMALAATALDLMRPNRSTVVRELAAYGETDLLCHRAERPDNLVERQRDSWQPLVDWAALTLDAPLAVTAGVLPAAQPPDALAAIERAVEAHDDLALAALSSATKASGSVVIALALSHRRLDAAAAFEAAELDETYQMELWGEDEEALRRRAIVRADLEAAERFLAILRG